MKTVIKTAVLAIFAFALIGCGGSSNFEGAEDAPVAVTPPPVTIPTDPVIPPVVPPVTPPDTNDTNTTNPPVTPPVVPPVTTAPFVTVWEIADSNKNLTIYTDTYSSYNFSVDWGDGTITQNATASTTHSYLNGGTYSVEISGTFPHFLRGKTTAERARLKDVSAWGDVAFRTMASSFLDTTNLTMSANDTPNLTQCTSFSTMFAKAVGFNTNINNWDVSNVSNFNGVFLQADAFNQPLNNWNTANATNMSGMFSYANSFNQNINNWTVSNVSDFSDMFHYANSFNQPLNGWNVEKGKVFTQMFTNAHVFNQPLDNWSTGSATSMEGMFWGAFVFNQSIGNWDVSNVSNMNQMLNYADKFNQNISDWDVSNVAYMDDFATGVTFSTAFYDALWNKWSRKSLQDNVYFDGGKSKYSDVSEANRQSVIDVYGWSISDGGLLP